MVIPFILFPMAEQRISSALAGDDQRSRPLVRCSFAALLLKRAPRRIQLAGLLVGGALCVLERVGPRRLPAPLGHKLLRLQNLVVGHRSYLQRAIDLD